MGQVWVPELIAIDVDGINWQEQKILLKPTKKRSNCTVFFDNLSKYDNIDKKELRESYLAHIPQLGV
jgi:hypothetical protein